MILYTKFDIYGFIVLEFCLIIPQITFFFKPYWSIFRFSINNKTGEVSVAGDLDREKVDEYYLSVEAKDGGGFRSTTELRIHVTDENDEYPEFRREEYFSSIKEKSNTFQRGALIIEVILYNKL